MTATRKQTELPPEVLLMALPQRMGWLDSAEAVETMTRAARRRHRRAMKSQVSSHLDMLAQQMEAARVGLLTWCCAVYWADLCRAYLEAKGLLSAKLNDNQHHCFWAGVYPQPGMIRCRECGVPTPPNCMSTTRSGNAGSCEDCRAGDLRHRMIRSGRTPYQNDRADLRRAAPDCEREAG